MSYVTFLRIYHYSTNVSTIILPSVSMKVECAILNVGETNCNYEIKYTDCIGVYKGEDEGEKTMLEAFLNLQNTLG